VDQEFVKGGQAWRSERQKSPSEVQGQSPVEGLVPQKLKQNGKLVYNFLRFPVPNLRFNKCRSRAWTVFLCKHTIKKIKI